MKYLLDTCVISEIRRPRGAARVKTFVSALAEDDLCLSALTISEIAKGIGGLAPGKKRRELTLWLDMLTGFHRGRILPVDEEIARIWGEMTANARAAGKTLPVIDGLIAGTAIRHNLTIVTRNTGDFEVTRARVLNPWEPV